MEPDETAQDQFEQAPLTPNASLSDLQKTKEAGDMLVGASMAVFGVALIQWIIALMPGAPRNEPLPWGIVLLLIWVLSLGLCVHLSLSAHLRIVAFELRRPVILRLLWAAWIGLGTLTLAWWGSSAPNSLSISSSLATVLLGVMLYLVSVGVIKRRKPADLFP